MKILALLLVVLSPSLARADSARFTTVFLDDEGVVYVGLKHGAPETSEVVSFPFKPGERTVIPLPKEVAARDVIGLLTEKEKLFVVTTPAADPGAPPSATDGPMLHVYDRDKGRWALVGKVACPAFTKVTLKPTSMTFSCEVGKSRKGKSQVVRKVIALRHNRIYRSGVWRFPEFLLRYKARTVLLEGPAPFWDRLRLRDANGERTITAEELLNLPLPGTGISIESGWRA